MWIFWCYIFLVLAIYSTCNFGELIIFLLLNCDGRLWTSSSFLEEEHVILENSFQYLWNEVCVYMWGFKKLITLSKDFWFFANGL